MNQLSYLLKYFLFTVITFVMFSCSNTPSPIDPIGPLPTERQMAWQELEYFAFIHFNMNTFTNKEWGYGDELPAQFNPTELDTRQWAKVAKESGMKGIILTAKHHDGFCLWPSAYTEHSVKNSPWREGKGDLLRELSEACQEYGLKMGVYLSPWDRNHPQYGAPEYITYFRNQLRELLTQYGDIFEVWFDGANGGDGYYGGANEERRVDKKTYYDWPTTHALVRELQPNAVMFSDAGPDIRWVGNEKGYANEMTWSPIYRDSVYGGMPDFHRFAAGQENGTHWIPTETDVSIRPGWYYHPEEDNAVKSLEKLVDIYFNSVGLNSALLLNLPVDDRGLIHENDTQQLMLLADYIKEMRANEITNLAQVSVSASRKGYKPNAITDADPLTFWAAPDGAIQSQITLQWDQPQEANTFEIQEYLPLGQRIKAFQLEVKTHEGWQTVATGTTIGNKRMLPFTSAPITAIRFTVNDAKAAVVISSVAVYNAPFIPIKS